MSINRNESFTLKFVCHIFIVVFIYALLLLFSTFRIYYSLSSSFKRLKRKVCRLFPIRKKNTKKGCTFTKCDGGSSILYGDKFKTKLDPTHRELNRDSIHTRGTIWDWIQGKEVSGATRPRPFSKHL